jgi:ribonuclease HII
MQEIFQETEFISSYDTYDFVIGADEAGRGCLLGPLVVGACGFFISKQCAILANSPHEVRDSKKMMPQKRQEVLTYLQENVNVLSSTCIMSAEFINERPGLLNVDTAEMEALSIFEILEKLENVPNFRELKYLIVTDALSGGHGQHVLRFLQEHLKSKDFSLNFDLHVFKKGDDKFKAISAGSIFAKCERDRQCKLLNIYKSGYYHDAQIMLREYYNYELDDFIFSNVSNISKDIIRHVFCASLKKKFRKEISDTFETLNIQETKTPEEFFEL